MGNIGSIQSCHVTLRCVHSFLQNARARAQKSSNKNGNERKKNFSLTLTRCCF